MPSYTVTVDSGSLVFDVPTTQELSPGTIGSPTAITRSGSLSIAYVDKVTDSSSKYVILPSGCSIGDVVEVYYEWDPTFVDNAWVLPPSGEEFVNDAAQVFAMNRFRKITSTLWGWIKGADVEA